MLSPRRFAMLLALTPGIGGRTLTRIMARMELLGMSPDEVLALSPEGLRESFGLAAKPATAVLKAADGWGETAAGIEKALLEKGVTLVAATDASYPARLDAFDPNAPGALFCYGNVRLLKAKTFCVLSSNKTSRRGLEVIEKLVEEGIFQSEVVVSGHDRPEYQRASIVPLRWGSPRILCFDRGLFQTLGEQLDQEPFRAARLWRYQFDPKTDLAISPFRPDAGFAGVNNQVRDRLIASLSDRLDFVEVSPGGQMEKLARMGLKAGRAVRVSDRSDNFQTLTREGAEPIATT